MEAKEISEIITAIRQDVVNAIIDEFILPKTMIDQWDIQGLEARLQQEFNVAIPVADLLEQDKLLTEQGLRERIVDLLAQNHDEKGQKIGLDTLQHVEKSVMLQVLDHSWKEHLAAMDYLRQGIHFRGYAQKDPKQEYKRESFEMFTQLLDHIKYEVVSILSKVQVSQEKDVQAFDEQMQEPKNLQFEHASASAMSDYPAENAAQPQAQEPVIAPFIREEPKVGRNDPCPCGSGKKFKQCHGKLD
jgi:preprotein translocase subunit SecA